MLLLLAILCLTGLAGAQQPRPCTSPNQWESRVHSSNPTLDADLLGRFSYDATYQRTRIVQHVKVGRTETYYDIISLYQAKVLFMIDLKSNNCSQFRFDQPWHDFGVDPDAKSLGEGSIGSMNITGAGLPVTIWSGKQAIPINETARYLQVWTKYQCLPVSDTLFEPSGSVNYLGYYDVTLGIDNPNVFIPPQQCLTSGNFLGRFRPFDLRASVKSS